MKLQEIILKEGGAALKAAHVGRIEKSDIPTTINYVSKLSGIPEKDLHILGSAGKSATSGDLDFGIDVNQFSPDKINSIMTDRLGKDNASYNKGFRIGSYAVPIAGDEGKGRVQVDFMFVDNPEWAKFSYFSAGTKSKYKGAIRTLLLMGIAAALNEEGTDHFEYDPDGSIVIRAGRTLDLNKGLRRIFQYRPKKASGEYMKSMKTISVDEFKKMFPDVNVSGGEVFITDPKKVLTILFGPGVKTKDVQTAEQVIKLIKQKFSKAKQEEIFLHVKQRAKSLGSKLVLPKELQ